MHLITSTSPCLSERTESCSKPSSIRHTSGKVGQRKGEVQMRTIEHNYQALNHRTFAMRDFGHVTAEVQAELVGADSVKK